MFDCSLVTDKLRTQDVHGAGDALSSALFMATMFGLMIQAILLVMNMSKPATLQSWLLGPSMPQVQIRTCKACLCMQCYSDQMVAFTGAAPSLIAPSVTYLKIRAWSAPAVLISMVAQVRVSALYLCTLQACAILLPMPCLLLSCCTAEGRLNSMHLLQTVAVESS